MTKILLAIFFLILALIGHFLNGYFFNSSKIIKYTISDIEKFLNFYINNVKNKTNTFQKNQKIAVGYAGDLDIVVEAHSLMKLLNKDIPPTPKYNKDLRNLNDFFETFAFFFEEGSGVEYYIENKSDFDKIVNKSLEIAKLKEMGGNGNVMALRAHQENCEVLLGCDLDRESFENLFDKKVNLVTNITDLMTDIHLVIDYHQNEKWGNLIAKRTNRFYLNHDIINLELKLLDIFHEKIKEFKPDVITLGGLHLFNNFEENKVKKVFQRIHDKLIVDKMHTKLHLEMGSFTKENIFDLLFKNLINQVHSLGMNEQELFYFLDFLHKSKEIKTSYDSLIDMNEIIKQMVVLLQLLSVDVPNIERIHFHSLNMHLICHKGNEWDDPKQALLKSIIIALQTCKYEDSSSHVDDFIFDPSKMELQSPTNLILSNFDGTITIKKINAENPMNCWNPSEEWKCCASITPNWKNPIRTRGLGDNISSTGLIYHKRKN